MQAPITSQRNDYLRRGARTLIQFVAGGGLTLLFDQVVADVPDRYDFYVLFLAGTLVSLAQNYCEDHGWIPALLKGRASSGVDPVPDPVP